MNPDLQDFAYASQTLNARGFYDAMRKTRLALGWDPAQRIDNSAVVVVESVKEPIEVLDGDPLKGIDPKTLRQRLGPQILYIRKIRRLPKGMPYPQQIQLVRGMFDNLVRMGKRSEIVVDLGDSGLAITQQMPSFGLYPTRLRITTGAKVTQQNGEWHVPKSVLVSLLDSHQNDGTIKLPALSASGNTPDDLEIVALKKEMANFTASYSANGSAAYAAAGSGHDDLVLATTYAVFALSERRGRNSYSVSDLATLL